MMEERGMEYEGAAEATAAAAAAATTTPSPLAALAHLRIPDCTLKPSPDWHSR